MLIPHKPHPHFLVTHNLNFYNLFSDWPSVFCVFFFFFCLISLFPFFLLTFLCPSLPAGWWWARWFRQRAGHGGRQRPLGAAVGWLLYTPDIQPSSLRYSCPHPGGPLRTRHPGQCGLHPIRVGPWLRPKQGSGESRRTRPQGEKQRARGGGWVSEDGCCGAVRSVQLYCLMCEGWGPSGCLLTACRFNYEWIS